ncbi:hypothetical protein AHMF7605_23930 [Adhaeribacter arboris]|uniref:Uncharacterized protein n=1 Tax=Adhaeribacter arboris TaxID=2072846 RepID=A0A2T2YLF7_9BACT|nr:hypothetical protein [Adhaeribacter arboris]PSR56327.1 hypothetical protein AHMF7605_23930 [Adhaeribacter arboris]
MANLSTEAWIAIWATLGGLILFLWLFFGDSFYKSRKYLPRHLQPGDKFMYRVEKVNGPTLFEVTYECRVTQITDKGVVTRMYGDNDNHYVTFKELEESKGFTIL